MPSNDFLAISKATDFALESSRIPLISWGKTAA
jgi:hypothetical protein